MRLSTITKHATGGDGSRFAVLLGREIRRRRLVQRLSQAEAGRPLTRAFLSSVEHGRITPSLPSLLIIARRLNSSAAAILACAERQLEDETTDGDAD
jgi:transcriptional regulator with XRE-family HTH domain